MQGDAPRFLVVGAGLSGAVLARVLADAGCVCEVFERYGHVAGHCHTSRDPETGIMMHMHGPHTLHSDNAAVWEFLERFIEIYPYRHLKWASVRGKLYQLPINRSTLSDFFGKPLDENAARALVASEAAPFLAKLEGPPANFEEAALSTIGERLYQAFYRGYTRKQWGIDPTQLPAAIFGRLPIRYDDDRNYFHHGRQGQPVGGYTKMIEAMLDHPNISVTLNRPFNPLEDVDGYDHVFYSGPLDAYFGHRHGRLAYRTLRFEAERIKGTHQICAVLNHCDDDTPYTRVTEHKHFAPWETYEDSVVFREYASECGPDDAPYYPLRLQDDRKRLDLYVEESKSVSGVTFLGRLGTYRYIDMDVAVADAMRLGKNVTDALRSGGSMPVFSANP